MTLCSWLIFQMWGGRVYRCFSDTIRACLLCCWRKLWIMRIFFLRGPAGLTPALKERKHLEWRFNEELINSSRTCRPDSSNLLREESFSVFMLLWTWGICFLLQSSPWCKTQLTFKSDFDLWNEESSLRCRAAVTFISQLSFELQAGV